MTHCKPVLSDHMKAAQQQMRHSLCWSVSDQQRAPCQEVGSLVSQGLSFTPIKVVCTVTAVLQGAEQPHCVCTSVEWPVVCSHRNDLELRGDEKCPVPVGTHTDTHVRTCVRSERTISLCVCTQPQRIFSDRPRSVLAHTHTLSHHSANDILSHAHTGMTGEQRSAGSAGFSA